MTDIFTLRDGGRLSYEVLGEPTLLPSLLLLRPLGGSMRLWGELATRLAQRRQVVAFDPRGVGASSDAPCLETTRRMAADAVELLAALHLPSVDVFGLSLGGMVASWLAIEHPAVVSRLILASTLPRAARISHHIYGHALSFARWFVRPGVEGEVGLVRQILSPEFRRAHPDRVAAICAEVRRSPSKRGNLAALALAAARHDAEPLLHTVCKETLVLVGDRDPIAGVRSQAELLHDLPRSRLVVIASSGHDLSLEQPLVTAVEIERFLDEDRYTRPTSTARARASILPRP